MTAIQLGSVAPSALELLESKWPASVDRASVLVTGEAGLAEIVLIPHRQLGGFSLGVFADDGGIDLFWGRITDLSTHDEIDLAARVARIPWSPAWRGAFLERLLAELHRPVRVTVRRPWFRAGLYAEVAIDGRTHDCLLARRGFHGLRDETTSLAADASLPVTLPVPLESWRKWAR